MSGSAGAWKQEQKKPGGALPARRPVVGSEATSNDDEGLSVGLSGA